MRTCCGRPRGCCTLLGALLSLPAPELWSSEFLGQAWLADWLPSSSSEVVPTSWPLT